MAIPDCSEPCCSRLGRGVDLGRGQRRGSQPRGAPACRMGECPVPWSSVPGRGGPVPWGWDGGGSRGIGGAPEDGRGLLCAACAPLIRGLPSPVGCGHRHGLPAAPRLAPMNRPVPSCPGKLRGQRMKRAGGFRNSPLPRLFPPKSCISRTPGACRSAVGGLCAPLGGDGGGGLIPPRSPAARAGPRRSAAACAATAGGHRVTVPLSRAPLPLPRVSAS